MKNKVLITFLSVLVLSVLFVACELSEAAQALETAIADAEALAKDAKIDDTDSPAVGTYTAANKKTLEDAIKAAQAVLDDASKDDAAKTTAKTTLETAVTAFEATVNI